MKNCDRRTVGIASSEASSAQNPQKPKFALSGKFLFFTASALICASLGLTQSVKAEETLTLAGIQSVLQGGPQALNSQQAVQPAGDEALSTLSAFAQQIGTPTAQTDRRFEDQAFVELQEFAQRLGTAQPQSIKDMSKVAAVKQSSASTDAYNVGSKACLTCHAKQTAEFEKTLMGKIGKTEKGKGLFACETCHGPGSAHVKAGGGRGVGGILSFGKDDPRSAEEKNGICLACHQKGQRNYWAGSVHEERGVSCTSCHTVMKNVSRKNSLKTAVQAETCYQCHALKRAEMQYSSHMPVREGKLTCSNCHNPHGSITEKLIRQASVNENCYTCHAEKRGPLLWEHAPVRENCLNCHKPHGSNYENLLVVARPRLCNECHQMAHSSGAGGGFGYPNTPYVLGRSCGNCHSAVHGSNHPNGMFFLR